MRLLRITLIAATIAAIATVSEAVRPYQMRRIYQQAIDHQSGGITVSDTRFFTGTDTGTMEERSHDGFLLNVRNTYVTGSGTSTFNNETNRLGGFSQLALGVANDVFYFCSEDDNAVYRYDTGSNVMTRMAGDGTPGLTAGTGTAAKIDCGQSAVQSARDDGRTKLYMFSGRPGASNYGIVSVVATSATGVDAGVLTIVAGSGTSGHTDATGTSAQIQNPHAMLYFKNTVSTKDYLIMSFDDNQGPIRYLDLTTGAVVTTMITYDATVLQSGTDNKAKLPAVTGLVNVPGKPFGFGITGSSRAFTLSWQPALGSFRVEFNPQLMSGKWGAAMKPDGTRVFFGNSIPGNGTIARFEVVPMTQSKSVPPTRTHTATHTPPSKTHPHTRSRTVPPPKTPAPPTPKPPTPAPTNAPPGSVTTLAPGATTNSTIDAAVGSNTYVACACAAAALLSALW